MVETVAEKKRQDMQSAFNFYSNMDSTQKQQKQDEIRRTLAVAGLALKKPMEPTNDPQSNRNTEENARIAQVYLGLKGRAIDGKWGDRTNELYEKRNIEQKYQELSRPAAARPTFKVEEPTVILTRRGEKEEEAKKQKIRFTAPETPEELARSDKAAAAMREEGERNARQRATAGASSQAQAEREQAEAARLQGNREWQKLRDKREAELTKAYDDAKEGRLPAFETRLHLAAASPYSTYSKDDPERLVPEIIRTLQQSAREGKYALADLKELRSTDLINKQTYDIGYAALQKRTASQVAVAAAPIEKPAPVQEAKREEPKTEEPKTTFFGNVMRSLSSVSSIVVPAVKAETARMVAEKAAEQERLEARQKADAAAAAQLASQQAAARKTAEAAPKAKPVQPVSAVVAPAERPEERVPSPAATIAADAQAAARLASQQAAAAEKTRADEQRRLQREARSSIADDRKSAGNAIAPYRNDPLMKDAVHAYDDAVAELKKAKPDYVSAAEGFRTAAQLATPAKAQIAQALAEKQQAAQRAKEEAKAAKEQAKAVQLAAKEQARAAELAAREQARAQEAAAKSSTVVLKGDNLNIGDPAEIKKKKAAIFVFPFSYAEAETGTKQGGGEMQFQIANSALLEREPEELLAQMYASFVRQAGKKGYPPSEALRSNFNRRILPALTAARADAESKLQGQALNQIQLSYGDQSSGAFTRSFEYSSGKTNFLFNITVSRIGEFNKKYTVQSGDQEGMLIRAKIPDAIADVSSRLISQARAQVGNRLSPKEMSDIEAKINDIARTAVEQLTRTSNLGKLSG